MLRVIAVNTGEKYSNWYTENLKHMIDKYSCLEYDKFEVIDQEEFGGVYDKIQIFNHFREGQNIFFDLDILIKGDCNFFLRKELTVCHAWHRKHEEYYKINPINSSIISWEGDLSVIYRFFKSDPEKLIKKFKYGMDEFLYQYYRPKMYTENFCSYHTYQDERDYTVYLFNQNYDKMRIPSWYSHYFL